MLVVQVERERRMVRLASCCTCLAFVSLIVAAILPMFVVTSLRGHGKLLVADFDVDLAIGDGLWKKNVCFGGSAPDENVLKQFGLSCRGSLQTAHCQEDGLNDAAKDRCEQFELMQGMQSLAIFATFVAAFIGSLARACASRAFLGTVMRMGSIASLGISLAAASAVISLVKESDMVDERNFSCSKVLGAELCHGYGVSYGLQWAALGNLMLAVLLHFILLFISPKETSSYQYVTVPLLQSSTSTQGVIISAPHPRTTASLPIATRLAAEAV